MALINNDIDKVRAFELPSGVWSNGKSIGLPRIAVVKWRSSWSDKFYQENCTRCQYLEGLGQNIGTIECSFRSEVDSEDDVVVTVDDPFLYAESKFKLGIKK